MNTLIAEKPETSNHESLAMSERPRMAREHEASRMPLAAGLLPYGLSLASLLRP